MRFSLLDGLVLLGGALLLTKKSSPPPPERRILTQLVDGRYLQLELQHIGDGKYLQARVAPAFLAMKAAAAAQGVDLHVNSAFRLNAEQEVFRKNYEAWLAAGKPMPVVAIAAKVGESNHEEGLATDIETAGGTNAAFAWLNGNAARFRFKRTVSSEPWHWEYV